MGVGFVVNTLQPGRRRATKESLAYSKDAAQLVPHAKHSSAL